MKIKDEIGVNRLLGEFIGTLSGVMAWDIPEELKSKLQSKLDELNKIEIISFNVPANHAETLMRLLNKMDDQGRLSTDEQNVVRRINVVVNKEHS